MSTGTVAPLFVALPFSIGYAEVKRICRVDRRKVRCIPYSTVQLFEIIYPAARAPDCWSYTAWQMSVSSPIRALSALFILRKPASCRSQISTLLAAAFVVSRRRGPRSACAVINRGPFFPSLNSECRDVQTGPQSSCTPGQPAKPAWCWCGDGEADRRLAHASADAHRQA